MHGTMAKPRRDLDDLDPDAPGTISYKPSPEVWAAILQWRKDRRAASGVNDDPGNQPLIEAAVRFFLEKKFGLPPKR